MIYDLLETYRKNTAGDTLARDNYRPGDGLYICLDKDGQDMGSLEISKKCMENGVVYDQKLYDFFKMADFYSRLLEMNKPVDPKKKIHSNNLYACTFKAQLLCGKDGIPNFIDSVKRYFDTLAHPKREEVKFLQEYAFPAIDTAKSEKHCQQIIAQSGYIRRKLEECGSKDNAYVKLFFYAAPSEYRVESERYILPKIFNTNAFNINIGGKLYGTSNSNMGLNSKKPFLMHLDTAYQVPFKISVNDAVALKNMFLWLDGQQDDKGKKIAYGYFPVADDDGFVLRKTPITREGLHFIRLDHVGNSKKLVISDYDFVSQLNNEMSTVMKLKNYLLLSDFSPENIFQKNVLEQKINELLFEKMLIPNYFGDDIKTGNLNTGQIDILLRYREALFSYFHKGDNSSLAACVDKLSRPAILLLLYKTSSIRLEYTSVAKAMNLRLSLLAYCNIGGTVMENRVKNISDNLKALFAVQKQTKGEIPDQYCTDSTEFYFFAGQVVRYIISLSQAWDLRYDVIDPIIKAKDLKKFKAEIIKLHSKYAYAIGVKNYRYNSLFAAVMSYGCESNDVKDGFDMFMTGLMSNNLIYYKDMQAQADSDSINNK